MGFIDFIKIVKENYVFNDFDDFGSVVFFI